MLRFRVDHVVTSMSGCTGALGRIRLPMVVVAEQQPGALDLDDGDLMWM